MESLSALIADASNVLVFTGAGISTGSGIPDFRGPKGLWKTRQPVMFQDFMRSEEARIEHWSYKLEGYEAFKNAKPNAAHRALVDLEHRDRLHCLVTQNIDGLHHDAGNDPHRIIELHGTNRLVECMSCGEKSDPKPAMDHFKRARTCPRCHCGGILKTATISFGQSMPEAEVERAFAAASRAKLVISIGSTLEVQPAASVPLVALKAGAKYCIVNRGDTAHDHLAHLRLEGDATEILPAAVAGLPQ